MPAKKKGDGPKDRYEAINSVLFGLYDEIDKLCKKAPAEPVTDLSLTHINAAITAVKELLKDDPFVDKIQPFVPAGENPELRDALMILRLLRQGMQRHADDFRSAYW